MAWDMWKRKNNGRDYGRGQPPPADSHEWAGVAPSAAEAIAREGRKKASAAKVAASATVGAEGEKADKKPWLFVIGGFVAGLIAGSWGRGGE
jgi:hypothetical protein